MNLTQVIEEVAKQIKKVMVLEGIPVSKYYSELKESGFVTPCIMIAPKGDSGSSIKYELGTYQKRNLGYQIIFFPAEKTVMDNKTLSQRKACEVVAEAIINMRYIGTLAVMNNVRYTIDQNTLVLTFSLTIRGKIETEGIKMDSLEEDSTILNKESV